MSSDITMGAQTVTANAGDSLVRFSGDMDVADVLSGLAAGIVNTHYQVGSALGLAVIHAGEPQPAVA